MFVNINGERHYLWRAVDREGEILENFVTKTRDKKAAHKFLRNVMRKNGQPAAIVINQPGSFGAALKKIGLGDRRENGCRTNDRAENSHLPFRRRERAMLRFWRMRSLRKFAPSIILPSSISMPKAVCHLGSSPGRTALPLLQSGVQLASRKV
jgi:putative transposase